MTIILKRLLIICRPLIKISFDIFKRYQNKISKFVLFLVISAD
jgi:hypothetical protein